MNNRILLVDDDANLLDGLQRSLRRQFHIETACGGPEGLSKIASQGPFAVIVSDMQMPGMSGLEFLRHAQVQAPDAVRLMLTGNADQKTAVDAVNDGRVFRFLTKPCPATALAPVLEAGLDQYRLAMAERELLENTLGGALKVLTEILSMIAPDTFQRGQRLQQVCKELAKVAGVTVTWEIEIAAMLHSLGRVTLPPSVLEKVRQRLPLEPAEDDLLRRVPEFGAALLEKIPRLENVASVVRYQDKHFDGSGSLEGGPAGVDIPFGARLLKIAGDLMDLEAQGLSRQNAWHRLDEDTRYDPDMLLAASHWCEVLPAVKNAPGKLVEIIVENLCPGQTLGKDIYTSDGLLLLLSGTVLTPVLVARLINFSRLDSISKTAVVRDT